jgi:energy-coupling factor transporter ATP-binding protein EcfA2
VGRNGSGKTTLLSCLAGLQPPAAGELVGPRAGLVFQHPEHQFTGSTVRQEVAFGLAAGHEERVEGWLRRFGLADFADHNPFQLSGGQQRRLSLAAMLVHDRPFLLADEPGYGLDRHASITAMRALTAAAAEGRGVVFSSHDLRSLCAYADRVLVLGEGRLLADTTPLALLHDEAVLALAGLRLPGLLAWLRDARVDEVGLRRVLRALDARALPEEETVPSPVRVPA